MFVFGLPSVDTSLVGVTWAMSATAVPNNSDKATLKTKVGLSWIGLSYCAVTFGPLPVFPSRNTSTVAVLSGGMFLGVSKVGAVFLS